MNKEYCLGFGLRRNEKEGEGIERENDCDGRRERERENDGRVRKFCSEILLLRVLWTF